MRLLSCLLSGQVRNRPSDCGHVQRKAGLVKGSAVDDISCTSKNSVHGSVAREEGAIRDTGNEVFIRLVHKLSSPEGGWWSALSGGCQATCDCLGASHACIFVLSMADFWATTAAVAGVGAAAAAGRAYSSDPRFNGSAPGAILRLRKDCPSQALLYRSVSGTAGSRVSSAAGAGAGAPAAISSSRDTDALPPCMELRAPDDLPGDWQLLYEEHGLNQFAAVLWTTEAGEPVGVLSLAAKGPVRPANWTPEALHCAVGLMSPHLRRAQAVLASAPISALHAAATLSDVVIAAAEAAVDVAAAVVHVRGSGRVAFMGESIATAAIFQPQRRQSSEGDSVPLLKVRGSSCDYVAMPTALRRSTTTAITAFSHMSIDGPGLLPGDGDRVGNTQESLKRDSFTPRCGFTTTNATNASFTMPHHKDAPCKGHTLMLHRTLLGEALSKQVAGLCIDNCQAYTMTMKAYPRDLLLSRGAIMPLSLALAATSADSPGPGMALYVTYGTSLSRPLLQTVVLELQQLLQAIMPIVAAKLSGSVRAEYEYLADQLRDAAQRRGSRAPGPAPAADTVEEPSDGGVPVEQHVLSFVMPGDAAAPPTPCPVPGVGGNGGGRDGSGADRASPACTPSTPTALPQALPPRRSPGQPRPVPPSLLAARAAQSPLLSIVQLTGGSSQQATPQSIMNTAAAVMTAEGDAATAVSTREPLEGDIDLDYPSRRASGTNLGRLQEMATAGSSLNTTERAQSACESDTARNRRLLSSLAVRSVSFRLEEAHVPRGASKLAPIIASMHDRLKAAQAVQMTNSNRSEARKQDLQSLKLLQEIGRGGYGTVYRGTFHGTEVAVKLIQQSRLAGVHSSSNVLASSAGLGLHKQNLHDAIELVASVSMSHINIVQVPAYFMDVRLEKPEHTSVDATDSPSDSRPFRLLHSPSFMDSPKHGQELPHAEGSMALVLEYCDCGSLCDAILNRKFIEKVTTKKPAPGSGCASKATPGKTFLAINMRSVYATLLEIALALRHMHSLALVHCDLKPQNVLLKSSPRDPRGFTAKLSDFGLAKMMAHDDQGQLVIDEAVASGTITHVAPEVLLGQQSLGAAVDIYAFGILMYQLLCGITVYDKMKSASVIAHAVAHSFMRPQLPSWVPQSYRSLAEACWAHEPSARPTASELVRHLERAIESKRAGSGGSGRTQPHSSLQPQQKG